MIFVRPTKSDSTLRKKLAEYLCHGKKYINELTLELSKLRKQQRLNPSEALQEEINELKKDIAITHDIWKRSEGFGIKVSGELRHRVLDKGFYKIDDKEEKIELIYKEWDEMVKERRKDLSISPRRVPHQNPKLVGPVGKLKTERIS